MVANKIKSTAEADSTSRFNRYNTRCNATATQRRGPHAITKAHVYAPLHPGYTIQVPNQETRNPPIRRSQGPKCQLLLAIRQLRAACGTTLHATAAPEILWTHTRHGTPIGRPFKVPGHSADRTSEHTFWITGRIAGSQGSIAQGSRDRRRLWIFLPCSSCGKPSQVLRHGALQQPVLPLLAGAPRLASPFQEPEGHSNFGFKLYRSVTRQGDR